jgi:putative ABC transport system permease protein
MHVLREWVRRLSGTLQRGRRDADLEEELRLHHEMAAEAASRRGLDDQAAQRAARLAGGRASQTMEALRDQRGVPFLDTLAQDVRYAVRSLRRAPAFTITVILTLAVGIGATTSIFSLINGLLLRALPVTDPHRLMTISSDTSINLGLLAGRGWNYPMWDRFRDRAQAFDGAFVWMPRRLNLGQGGEMQLVDSVITSGDFFSTLGVRAVLGRTFTANDDRRGGGPDGPVTVISHGFWQRHLAGAGNVIGTPLVIERVPFTIIGVTPPGFVGVEVGRSFDVALTFGMEPMVSQGAAIDQPGAFGLIPMVRLKAGQTLETATAAIRALQPEILGSARVPPFVQEPFVLVPAPTGTSATDSGMSGLRRRYERPLFTVLMVVGLLLIIACANIANLLLVRASARRRELSVRLALGASRWRLAGQLLVESLVLGITGALCALVLAGWTTTGLVGQLSTTDTRVALDVPFDWRVLAFTTAVTTVTVLLFGAAPAFSAARAVPMDAMKGHDRAGSRPSQGGTTRGIVVAQVALSLVLLVSAGLFVRTLSHLAAAPLGFDRHEVLLVTVDTMRASIAAETRLPLYERLIAAVSAVPGVDHAAASAWVPVRGGSGRLKLNAQMSDAGQMTLFNYVSPGWFATYGTRFVAGRDFDEHDSANASPVVIVNETLARALFPGRDPIGERVVSQAPDWPRPRMVVGVVGDAVYASLRVTAQAGTALREPVAPTVYMPLAQSEGSTFPGMSRITIGVRPAAGSPSRLAASVGAALSTIDPNVAFSFRSLAEVVSAAFAQERLVAILSGFFGGLALVLAAIGLYGVTSYAVSRRRAEIGVRMVLGAAPGSVVRLILRRVVILMALGVIEGTALSIWISSFASSLLYGLQPNDPATLIGAILTLSAVGLAAAWLPARRAGRIEPVEALRES